MRTCEFCGEGIPNYAGFCGSCGQIINRMGSAEKTHAPRPIRRVTLEDEQTARIPEDATLLMEERVEDRQTGVDYDTQAVDYANEDDEEERRRLAMVDFNMPLLPNGGMGQAPPTVPMVQGTPQIGATPMLGGTPNFGAEGYHPPAWGEAATPPPLVLPGRPTTVRPTGIYGPKLNGRPGPHLPNKPQTQNAPGCATWLVIVIIIPLILLGSIIGIGLTILAPALTLEGSANVAPGGLIHLHGSHFIPADTVTCTLDGTTALYSSVYQAGQQASKQNASVRAMADQIGQATQQAAGLNIMVGVDGTFNATFTAQTNWSMGEHTIRATEALSPRSATITFTVNGSATATATATVTDLPTPSPTASPSPTPSPAPGTGLSAISPSSVTFGPISTGYTQAVTTQLTLATQGSGLLNWKATWDQVQAPWLQLNPTSGQVQAPNTQALAIGAVAGTLTAGTYNATITFSSNAPGGQSITLNVALNVQAGCLSATPNTLNFNGTVGTNDPPAQTVTLNNCGGLGNWSATTSGGSWLVVSPTSGNLNNGGNQSIVVSTALANIKSGAGIYQGQIQFTNGQTHITVMVTLTVQKQPVAATLSSNTSVISTRQCKLTQSGAGVYWLCSLVTLSSNQDATSNLDWSSASSGIAGIQVKPASGTLQPGQAVAIEIDIPRFPCTSTGTVVFTGPTNKVSVALGC